MDPPGHCPARLRLFACQYRMAFLLPQDRWMPVQAWLHAVSDCRKGCLPQLNQMACLGLMPDSVCRWTALFRHFQNLAPLLLGGGLFPGHSFGVLAQTAVLPGPACRFLCFFPARRLGAVCRMGACRFASVIDFPFLFSGPLKTIQGCSAHLRWKAVPQAPACNRRRRMHSRPA